LIVLPLHHTTGNDCYWPAGIGIEILAFSAPFNLTDQRKISISMSLNIVPFHQSFYHLILKLPSLLALQ